MAAELGRLKIVQLLVKFGADMRAPTKVGLGRAVAVWGVCAGVEGESLHTLLCTCTCAARDDCLGPCNQQRLHRGCELVHRSKRTVLHVLRLAAVLVSTSQ